LPRLMKSHTVVANGERSGSMRSRSQMGKALPFFAFNGGAISPMPASPWQTKHPFSLKSSAPSLAVPRPGGSSSPVGPIEISKARISSAVGARPTPNLGDDCANAGPARMSAIATSLSEPIGHAPVPGDLPRHNAVVQPRHSVISLKRHVPVLGDLLSRRLLLPDLVGAARKNLGFVSIPIPLIADPGVRHALWSPLDLGGVPLPPAIGGSLHGTNGAPAGPGQPLDLVKSAAGQLLSAGRVSDDRLGSDLVAERSFFRLPIEMPELVVVHVIPVDDLDAPQILGVEDSLEAVGHQAHWKPVLRPHGFAVHAVGDEAVGHRFGAGHARCALHFLGALSDEPCRAAFQAALLEQR